MLHPNITSYKFPPSVIRVNRSYSTRWDGNIACAGNMKKCKSIIRNILRDWEDIDGNSIIIIMVLRRKNLRSHSAQARILCRAIISMAMNYQIS